MLREIVSSFGLNKRLGAVLRFGRSKSLVEGIYDIQEQAA